MSTPISWLHDTTVGAWIAAEQLTEHGTVGALVPPRFESYVSVRLTGEDATVINPDRALREHLVATIKAGGPRPGGCIFGVSDVYGWDGRLVGAAPRPSESSPPPVLETAVRSYTLYRGGGIDDAAAVAQAGGPTEIPDLWWPDDRSWFVATDTDLQFVLVGGPRRLTTRFERPGVHVEEVSAESRLA